MSASATQGGHKKRDDQKKRSSHKVRGVSSEAGRESHWKSLRCHLIMFIHTGKGNIFHTVTVLFDLDLWTWPRYCQDEPTRQTSRFICSRKGHFSHCHCDLWPMTVIFEHDLHSVKTNQHDKHQCQRSFISKVILQTHQTHTHTGPTALPGPLM